MAYTRHLYPQQNFVFTECAGTIDDQSFLIHLMSLHAESTKFNFVRELVDARHLRNFNKLTVQGFIRIAEKHKELFPKKDFYAAVLVDGPQFGMIAEVYSQLVQTMQLKVKVFQNNIDESLAWLGYENDHIFKLKRFINKHAKAAK